MKERIIHDPGQPVAIRRYANESLAALERAVLEAANIPAFLQQGRYAEVDAGTVVLVVRREHARAALELLDANAAGDEEGIEPPEDNL